MGNEGGEEKGGVWPFEDKRLVKYGLVCQSVAVDCIYGLLKVSYNVT